MARCGHSTVSFQVPFIFLGELAFVALVHTGLILLRKRGVAVFLLSKIWPEEPKWNREPYIRTTMSLVLWSYTQLTSTSLRFFQVGWINLAAR